MKFYDPFEFYWWENTDSEEKGICRCPVCTSAYNQSLGSNYNEMFEGDK